ncbi:MAG TPA: hypothetical protein VFV58_24055 [Blastocatellia bacterium]|jgi:hypothetical protein|nr:hypothetical protein [Blastocatellia bacterium]
MTAGEYQQLIGAPRYTLGLDLGQAQDYTALCVLEARGEGDAAEYQCRALKRWELMTSYPTIVSDLALMLRRAPFSANHPHLGVDTTGVGRAVWDMLRQANLTANLRSITIHAGVEVTRAGAGFGVPKRDLVSAVQVVLQTRRLKFVPSLPEAETIKQELANFRIKLSASGHDTYNAATGEGLSWREAPHDDLVLALAVALWLDQRPRVSFGRTIGII